MLGLGIPIIYQAPVSVVHNTTTNTYACHFDGFLDTLTVSDVDDLSFSGGSSDDDVPFSIAAWVKRDATVSDGFCHKGNAGIANLEYRIFWHGSGGAAKLYMDISAGTVGSSSGYRRVTTSDSSTSWHHIILTYTGVIGGAAEKKIYFNGVEQSLAASGSDAAGMTPSSGNLIIGDIDNSGYDFGGEMCQFIMWKNHVITPFEASYLYANGEAHRNPILSASDYSQAAADAVVLWLPLQDDLTDSTTNGYDSVAGGNAALSNSTVPF